MKMNYLVSALMVTIVSSADLKDIWSVSCGPGTPCALAELKDQAKFLSQTKDESP